MYLPSSNQGSAQTLIEFPLPICLEIPFRSKALACSMLFQAKDGFFPTTYCRKYESPKYLLLSTIAHRLYGFCRILQACLANKAWLKYCMSLNPRPPFCLDRQSLSQLIQWIFFFFHIIPLEICHSTRQRGASSFWQLKTSHRIN